MSLGKKLNEKGRPKVIICGTRTFEDKKLLFKKMDFYTLTLIDPIIVTGGQKKRVERKGEWTYQGADYWGEQWAYSNYYLVKIFYPDWDAHGKKAGPIRNREMAEYVGPKGFLIAFWDGVSPGTKNMIEEAKRVGMKDSRIRVVEI